MPKDKQADDIFEKLKEPFPVKVLKWRAGATNNRENPTQAIALAYIDARDVMGRFDDVVGFDGWQCRHVVTESGINTCEIGLFLNGEWIWKANGAGETNFEGAKGGYSDALKRTAAVWGVGRYLYYLPNKWVKCEKKGKQVKLLETPELPAWAIPEKE
jgi:hypothetical protein